MENKEQKKNLLNKRISLSSKVGISVSLALIVIGLMSISLSGYKNNEPLIPPAQLPQAIMNLNPAGIITLAVLILLVTPVSQIIIALVTLISERDKIYSGICLLLLCILAISVILSFI